MTEIKQAWSEYVDGHGQFQSGWQTIVIGDDNKVYAWDSYSGEWVLNIVKQPITPDHSTSINNLDDIPF